MVSRKTFPTRKLTKTTALTHFYILPIFLLIIIALLIAAGTYCYLIKYLSKQRHLLPYYDTSNKLKE